MIACKGAPGRGRGSRPGDGRAAPRRDQYRPRGRAAADRYAAGWPPAARSLAEMDRFFVAIETWITAYVDGAKGIPNAPDPGAAAAVEVAGRWSAEELS